MANIKTYDLIQCSRLYPTVEGSNNASFLPYINKVVKINDDEEQSYTVKENVQARFFAPRRADLTSDVQYSVTSLKFKGIETLYGPANLTVSEAQNIYLVYPFYGGNPNGYEAGVATATITNVTPLTSGTFERNFPDFMQSLFDAVEIPVQITNSNPFWWSVDGFEVMENFMIEMYSSDSLDFTMTETYNGVSRELRYVVNLSGATAYINGVDVTSIPVPVDEQPQFGDVYSIKSVPTTANPIEEIECCPVVSPFYASLQRDCESSLNVDCDCSKITFSDTSNYDNGLIGHDPLFFNYRKITLERPDGTSYVWSTDGTGDENIPPHYNSSNMFSYTLSNSDQDGVYSVEICAFPDWQNNVYYDLVLNNYVYHSGKIYKQVASSTGIEPDLDLDNNFWVEVTADDNMGRYCSEQKIVLLCKSIMTCYKNLVEKALCGIKANPCKSMCDNKEMLNAMKMRVTMDALNWAVCAENWDLVDEHMSILKSICCCNGC